MEKKAYKQNSSKQGDHCLTRPKQRKIKIGATRRRNSARWSFATHFSLSLCGSRKYTTCKQHRERRSTQHTTHTKHIPGRETPDPAAAPRPAGGRRALTTRAPSGPKQKQRDGTHFAQKAWLEAGRRRTRRTRRERRRQTQSERGTDLIRSHATCRNEAPYGRWVWCESNYRYSATP